MTHRPTLYLDKYAHEDMSTCTKGIFLFKLSMDEFSNVIMFKSHSQLQKCCQVNVSTQHINGTRMTISGAVSERCHIKINATINSVQVTRVYIKSDAYFASTYVGECGYVFVKVNTCIY